LRVGHISTMFGNRAGDWRVLPTQYDVPAAAETAFVD